jgi:hypothetical protein
LVSEFVEPLGRVVFGAELEVAAVFKKPETLVGAYFIVAINGAEFPGRSCYGDDELVAVDLSNSRLRQLPWWAFKCCGRLAAVAFPAELVKIGWRAFLGCTALTTVDIASTAVKEIEPLAFARGGLLRVSLPASLRELHLSAFRSTPLAALDLSVSADLTAKCDTLGHSLEVTELRLPQKGFVELAAALLPDSRVEILYADIDKADIEQLLLRLDGWAIDRLRVVSPRLDEPFEWVRGSPSRSVAVTDSAVLDVTLAFWGQVPKGQLRFVRSIDLSALCELPAHETLSSLSFLESVILPAGIRVVPDDFFKRCPRLWGVGTADCVALDEIRWDAFLGCRNLREFAFPLMIRKVRRAFGGTSFVRLDLSETQAESVGVQGMKFLERLVLPRRCILEGALGLPALRSVTFGVCSEETRWSPREVRFESLAAPAKSGPLAVDACVFGEVACLLGRGSFPFPP